jgi:hypothetical protein
VRVSIEVEHNRDLILNAVLDPPRFEAKRLDLVLLDERIV